MSWRRRRSGQRQGESAPGDEPRADAAVGAAVAGMAERETDRLLQSVEAVREHGDRLRAAYAAAQDANRASREYQQHGDPEPFRRALAALRAAVADPLIAQVPAALGLPLLAEGASTLLAGYEAFGEVDDLRLAARCLDHVVDANLDGVRAQHHASALDSALGGPAMLLPQLERLAQLRTQHVALAQFAWWRCARDSTAAADLEHALAAGERAVAEIPAGDQFRASALALLADTALAAADAGCAGADPERAVDAGEQLLREVRGTEEALAVVASVGRRCRMLLARCREVPRTVAITELAALPTAPGWDAMPDDVKQPLEELLGVDDSQLAELIAARPPLLDETIGELAADLQLILTLAGSDEDAWRLERRLALLAECRRHGIHAGLDRLLRFDAELVERVRPLVGERTASGRAAMLRADPELAGDEAFAVQRAMIDRVREQPSVPDDAYRASLELVAHARARSVAEACDYEIDEAERSVPETVRVHIDAGRQAMIAFQRTDDRAALDEATDNLSAAIADPRFTRAPASVQSDALATICRCWAGQAERSGGEDELSKAIATGERAVAVSRPASGDLETALVNLGLAHYGAFKASGRPEPLRAASDTLARVFDEVDPQIQHRALVLHNLANVQFDLAWELQPELLAAALDAYWESVRRTPEGIPERAVRLSGLGTALSERFERLRLPGDLDDSILMHERGLAAAMDASSARSTCHNLANALMTRSDLLDDDADLERAIDLLEEMLAGERERDDGSANARRGMATALLRRYARHGRFGDLQDAVHLLREVVPTYRGPHQEATTALSNLAGAELALYMRGGDPAELEQSLAHLDETEGRTQRGSATWARFRAVRGNALLQRAFERRSDEDLTSAVAAYRDALEVLAEDDLERAPVVSSLARALHLRYRARGRDRRDLDDACRMFEWLADAPVSVYVAEALADRFELDGDPSDARRATEHFAAAVKAPAVSDRVSIGASWGAWAAERGAWEEARRAYAHGIEALEQLYEVQGSPAGRELSLEAAQSLPLDAAYADARAGEPREAVLTLERARARRLSQTLELDDLDLERLRAEGEQERADRFAAARSAYRDLEALATAGGTDAPSASKLDRAAEAMHATGEAIQALEGYRDFLRAAGWSDVARAAAATPLVYLVAAERGGVAFVMTPQAPHDVGPTWLPALTRAAVREHLDEFAAAHRRRHDDRESWRRTLGALLGWLWDAAMRDVVAALDGERTATLIPTGLLAHLPLHAAGRPGDDYVLDQIALASAPNCRVLQRARVTAAHASAPGSILAVGEPRPTSAPELPHAGPLAAAATTFFAEGRALVGPDATFDNVIGCLGRHRVYHFSCHGRADAADPLATSLLLAHDEPLTVRSILAEPRQRAARLAVLAACESAVVGDRVPDELVALPTALLECGVAGVVASQWTVLADSAVMLLLRFYDEWPDPDESPVQALRTAQKWLRDTTNAEKARYFEQCTTRGAGTDMAELAASLHASVAFADPGAKSHADAVHWAAFDLVGV